MLIGAIRCHSVPLSATWCHQCHPVPFGAILALFSMIQCHLLPFGALKCQYFLYGPVRCHMVLYGDIQCHLVPFGAIPFGAIGCYLVAFSVIWCLLGPFGAIRCNSMPFLWDFVIWFYSMSFDSICCHLVLLLQYVFELSLILVYLAMFSRIYSLFRECDNVDMELIWQRGRLATLSLKLATL